MGPGGGRCRDEHATVALLAKEYAGELVDPGPVAHRVDGIPLCLHRDAVEAERILVDDPVDAGIASGARPLGRAGPTRTPSPPEVG